MKRALMMRFASLIVSTLRLNILFGQNCVAWRQKSINLLRLNQAGSRKIEAIDESLTNTPFD
ncbi:hypothetical protein [Roseinatronobacter bogoriensis]|uniref:hypothetical protein n=1 Tax=Roseinatronobacter bogoriensis TaxID=119542 RepID=UPI0014562B59|nr:hypothetical protein [Rhodobaca bogoriensis]